MWGHRRFSSYSATILPDVADCTANAGFLKQYEECSPTPDTMTAPRVQFQSSFRIYNNTSLNYCNRWQDHASAPVSLADYIPCCKKNHIFIKTAMPEALIIFWKKCPFWPLYKVKISALQVEVHCKRSGKEWKFDLSHPINVYKKSSFRITGNHAFYNIDCVGWWRLECTKDLGGLLFCLVAFIMLRVQLAATREKNSSGKS